MTKLQNITQGFAEVTIDGKLIGEVYQKYGKTEGDDAHYPIYPGWYAILINGEKRTRVSLDPCDKRPTAVQLLLIAFEKEAQ